MVRDREHYSPMPKYNRDPWAKDKGSPGREISDDHLSLREMQKVLDSEALCQMWFMTLLELIWEHHGIDIETYFIDSDSEIEDDKLRTTIADWRNDLFAYLRKLMLEEDQRQDPMHESGEEHYAKIVEGKRRAAEKRKEKEREELAKRWPPKPKEPAKQLYLW